MATIDDNGAPEPAAMIEGPAHRSRLHRSLRHFAVGVAALLVVATITGLLGYHRQIYSTLTHRKGAPSVTKAYEPLPATPAPLLRLAAAGDTGDSGTRLDATADAMARLGKEAAYDALLLLGDNVYPGGDPERLQETVFDPFDDVLDQGAALLAILGNHDVSQGHGDAQIEALGMPGRWWARDLGDVLIVGLDSSSVDSTAQRDFLEETLAASDESWKVVALHHPPYSAGYHGSSTDARSAFSPVFERYGVQLALSGHEHDYQRSKEIGGVTYVVSGAGSGTRRTGEAGFTAVSWSSSHFLDITFYEDHLLLRAVNQQGRVADEAVIAP